MSGSSQPASATGSTPSITSFYVPPGSNDVGWKYCYLQDKSDFNTVTCRLCGKVMKGGINRAKQHLAHIKGNVASCTKATPEIQREIKEYREQYSKKKQEKTLVIQEMRNEVVIKNADVAERDLKRSRGIESGGSRQSSIKDAFCKEERARVSKYIAQLFYECDIPFNVVTNPAFIRAVEAIGQYGVGYKLPTYYEISETLLQEQVKETKDYLVAHKESWKSYGCTIMTDAWTDMRGRSIMNFCINCDLGTSFLKSIDASAESHNAEYICALVEKCIEEVGETNVVQIVTDNASANIAAGRLLKIRYPSIYWTSCAAHTIDLMLEEIGKEAKVKSAISKAKELTNFIYAHSKTLSMMRRYTKKRDIVRPGQTRFATTFLTLQSILEKKEKLRLMFSSDEWRASKWSTSRAGAKASAIVFNVTWWQQVTLSLKVFSPLVHLLRIVDGDRRPSMGFVYGGLADAKKEVMATFKDESQYKPYIDAIDGKAKERLDSPLHLAAYYLNPYYYYRDRDLIENDGKAVNGFLHCLEVFYPDLDVQDLITMTELSCYKKELGSFGRPLAIRQRSNNHDDFDPADWWSLHGLETPHLKKMAMKILKLTSSSSGCERNWSSFEAVHTKKRNRLELKRMNDLVYVKFNSKLRERQRQTKKKDPLATKDRTHAADWLAGGQDEEVFEGAGLTWDMVSEASGAEEACQNRRSQRLAPPTTTLEEIEEDFLSEEETDDDDLNDLELDEDSD